MRVTKSILLAAVCTIGVSIGNSAIAQDGARILHVENFVGRIDLKSTNSRNLEARVIPGRKQSASIRQEGATFKVVGNLGRINNVNCQSHNGRRILTINGTRYEPDDLPTISGTISSANGLRIINSEISGQVGDVGGVKMELFGCGDIVFGNIRQDLDASISGSGSLKVGNVGANVKSDVSGSGDIDISNIGGDLELSLSGSGDFKSGRIAGQTKIEAAGSSSIELASARNVEADIAGSGTVTINGGRGNVRADISGSADLIHRGIAISPIVEISGSGDAKFSQIEGPARISKN